VGFLVDGGWQTELVEIDRLLLVAVYDEEYSPKRRAIRVIGCRGKRIDHGVQWGGLECCEIYKDLGLSPLPRARGLRIDLADTQLLHLALRLHHRIDQALRFQPSLARRQLRLPRLWAGYKARDAQGITGSGPEFEGLCQKFAMAPAAMFKKFEREHFGLRLYPMEWTSHCLDQAKAVFAELTGFPQRQAFGVSGESDLLGYVGAAAFDFFSSRFRAVGPEALVNAIAPTLGRTA
jgi:hypothetical protein